MFRKLILLILWSQVGSNIYTVLKSISKSDLSMNAVTYTIKPGDTLSQIATTKRIPLEKLYSLNSVDPRNLAVGSKIILSKSKPIKKNHTANYFSLGISLVIIFALSSTRRFSREEERILRLKIQLSDLKAQNEALDREILERKENIASLKENIEHYSKLILAQDAYSYEEWQQILEKNKRSS